MYASCPQGSVRPFPKTQDTHPGRKVCEIYVLVPKTQHERKEPKLHDQTHWPSAARCLQLTPCLAQQPSRPPKPPLTLRLQPKTVRNEYTKNKTTMLEMVMAWVVGAQMAKQAKTSGLPTPFSFVQSFLSRIRKKRSRMSLPSLPSSDFPILSHFPTSIHPRVVPRSDIALPPWRRIDTMLDDLEAPESGPWVRVRK